VVIGVDSEIDVLDGGAHPQGGEEVFWGRGSGSLVLMDFCSELAKEKHIHV